MGKERKDEVETGSKSDGSFCSFSILQCKRSIMKGRENVYSGLIGRRKDRLDRHNLTGANTDKRRLIPMSTLTLLCLVMGLFMLARIPSMYKVNTFFKQQNYLKMDACIFYYFCV